PLLAEKRQRNSVEGLGCGIPKNESYAQVRRPREQAKRNVARRRSRERHHLIVHRGDRLPLLIWTPRGLGVASFKDIPSRERHAIGPRLPPAWQHIERLDVRASGVIHSG